MATDAAASKPLLPPAADYAASKPLLPPAADYGKSQSSASEWEEDGYRGHSFFHGRNMADEDKAAGGSMRWWAAALILFYFVLGITYYTYFADPEHFDFLDSVYFCVTTLTTVGYGDLNTKYDEDGSVQDMIFTSCFVLLGVGLIGTALGVVMAYALDQEDAIAATLREDDDFDPSAPRTEEVCGLHLSEAEAKVAFQVPMVCGLLALGTVCYKFIEDTTVTVAFYWTAVSVTTVGYGDVFPSTRGGKIFAMFFLLGGCGVMAKAVGDVAGLPLERRKRRNEQAVLAQYGEDLDPDEFHEILTSFRDLGLAAASDGSCSKTEFVLSMLLKLDRVNQHDIRRCARVFDDLDIDKSGRLDKADLAKKES